MNYLKTLFFLSIIVFGSSCVSKKKFVAVQDELNRTNEQLGKCGESLNEYMGKLGECKEKTTTLKANIKVKDQEIKSLKDQLADAKSIRDKQLNQVGDLTKLSQSANDNIKNTLAQLEKKDKYISLLQKARTRADSINLALAVNLKSALQDGLDDEDVTIEVDKTVVFINISDKMLYQSGSYRLTSRADQVLSKIARIVEQRPQVEVMVEGYTDNVPISSGAIKDNWDLSVMRATSVVRELQEKYGVDPNRMIAAGRGEWNALADNATAEGRSANRRTRIILLPKLEEFYDLLDPNKVPE